MFIEKKSIHETTCIFIVFQNFTRVEKTTGENSKEINESFEKIPFYVAILAYMGFHFLLFLGYLNQFLFPPKVAKEKNREVSKAMRMRGFRYKF